MRECNHAETATEVSTVSGAPGRRLGTIFNIQRFSIHDGPGIRTTVFLKGCPLRCAWCHNPEGSSHSQVISFLPGKCLACGECVAACPEHAHRLEAAADGAGAKHIYNREACKACGQCVEHCDARALEVVARQVTVEEVMKEVRQDKPFYSTSGGGMTISGGEPLAQIDFAAALLQAAKDESVHRCVETSGFVSWRSLERALPLVDLFLFDFKETDPVCHAEFTGQSNELILKNLRALHDAGARIQLQCPIIPGFNYRDDHFGGIAALARSLPNLVGVQLLPYHPLGKSKGERFGLPLGIDLPNEPLPMARLEPEIEKLQECGVRVVTASGSLAMAGSRKGG